MKDLRPIALTPLWSKLFETILRKWILHDIKPTFSLEQYGGVAGVGTSQYLMSVSHQVLAASEHKKIALTLAFGFTSAFNCLEHTKVVEAAQTLGVRYSIVSLLTSCLSDRFTQVQWSSALSEPILCRGGSGQGTILSVLLFLMAVDNLIKRMRSNHSRGKHHQYNSHRHSHVCRWLVIDYLLGSDCISAIWKRRSYIWRWWQDLSVLKNYWRVSEETGMKLNKAKTAALLFNFSLQPISMEALRFPSGDGIELFKEIKLLGVLLDNKLSLWPFVKQRKAAAMAALWSIQRLKQCGIKSKDLCFAYTSYVRSVLEYGVPAVFPLLGAGQLAELESIQCIATRVILGVGYDGPSYEERLKALDLTKLSVRWKDQFEKLATKAEFEPRFKSFFKPSDSTHPMSLRGPRTYQMDKPKTEKIQEIPDQPVHHVHQSNQE